MRRGLGTLFAGVAAGLLAVGVVVVDSPGAGAEDALLGYDMTADARGVQLFTVIPEQRIQPELDIPQASTTQQSGTGYGLASAAWPGATVANGGALLGLLIKGFPPAISQLLIYPVKAEARTGQDPPVTSYDTPGLMMRSRADDTSAEADAGVQGLSLAPAGGLGAITTSASSRATVDAAVSTARSVIADVNIGGVLKIKKIVSTATASSDGVKGSTDAHTTIVGATVMGQGVTIDETGLHFGSTKQPVDAIVQQVAKKALDAAGIKVAVGPVTNEVKGASALAGANSLVITFTQQGYTVGLNIGGARASSVASSPDADLGGDVSDGGGTDVLGSGEDLGGFALDGGPDLGGLVSTPGGTKNPTINLTPTVAVAKGEPLSHAAMVLGALAAVLVGVGLRRLNTSLFADPSAALPCPLPGEDA